MERFLELLPNEPADLVREDNHFKDLGLNIGDYQSADAVVDLLLEHPKLMQRPVVVRGDRAVIARPSEVVEELL
ncbi:arsenate reductase family protein [Candidatus Poriferisocius sp.]|uniref:arsenate reductase family protein n=1 Tax=Candidatus Poriferisocius sp. TaxID=3101276 RepID=UPI003B018CF9